MSLDELILARITCAPATFSQLQACDGIARECTRLSDLRGRQPFRILDGRLIALRKKGLIVPDRKAGWSLAK